MDARLLISAILQIFEIKTFLSVLRSLLPLYIICMVKAIFLINIDFMGQLYNLEVICKLLCKQLYIFSIFLFAKCHKQDITKYGFCYRGKPTRRKFVGLLCSTCGILSHFRTFLERVVKMNTISMRFGRKCKISHHP